MIALIITKQSAYAPFLALLSLVLSLQYAILSVNIVMISLFILSIIYPQAVHPQYATASCLMFVNWFIDSLSAYCGYACLLGVIASL